MKFWNVKPLRTPIVFYKFQTQWTT
jgi:hypothetical protein